MHIDFFPLISPVPLWDMQMSLNYIHEIPKTMFVYQNEHLHKQNY